MKPRAFIAGTWASVVLSIWLIRKNKAPASTGASHE